MVPKWISDPLSKFQAASFYATDLWRLGFQKKTNLNFFDIFQEMLRAGKVKSLVGFDEFITAQLLLTKELNSTTAVQ